MKKTLCAVISISLLASVAGIASASASEDPTRLECSFGVKGFNESDPEAFMEILHLVVPFKPGTRELSAEGTSVSEVTNPVKIASSAAQEGELYRFVGTIQHEGDDPITIPVKVRKIPSQLKEIPDADRPSTLDASAGMDDAVDSMIGVCALQ